jgi:hypothetical protein
MSTPPAPPSPEPTSPPPGSDDVEKSYWDKFTKHVEATVNKVIDDRLKNSGTGTSRTGRTTFRDMLSDFMGGPFNKPQT